MPARDCNSEENDHDESSDRCHERSRGRGKRGAAPIVSTILVVGIVVVLGAVVATLALGLGENVQDSPPEAAFVCTENGNVQHVAGDNIPVERLEGVGQNQVEGDTLTAGESVSVDELVWEYRGTSHILTECDSTSLLSFGATVGLISPPYTVPANTSRLNGAGRLSIDLRDRNGNRFDPPGGVDVEITQNPDDKFELVLNGTNQGDNVTGLNTSNGTFTDNVGVLPTGVLDRTDEYRVELTASDSNGNEASEVLRFRVADYEIQSLALTDVTNNSGTSGDDTVTFTTDVRNHADSDGTTTVEVRLFEGASGGLSNYAAAAEKTVQIPQGTNKTFTQADFPGLITDDQTIEDGNQYFLYVIVTEAPNLLRSGRVQP